MLPRTEQEELAGTLSHVPQFFPIGSSWPSNSFPTVSTFAGFHFPQSATRGYATTIPAQFEDDGFQAYLRVLVTPFGCIAIIEVLLFCHFTFVFRHIQLI